MSDKNNNILSVAMNYALLLGLFWVFKYLFAIGGSYHDIFKYIFQLLSIGTPVVFYVLLCRYRDVALGGKILYGQCILFSLLLFIFASIPEAVIMSLHLLIINPEIVAEQNRLVFDLMDKMKMVNINSAAYEQTKSFLSSYGALYYTASNVIGNVIIGFCLSLILGYFVSIKSPNPTQND